MSEEITESIEKFNDTISALHSTRPAIQTETPMIDFLNSDKIKIMLGDIADKNGDQLDYGIGGDRD